MPSASTKVEKSSPLDGEQPIKQVLLLLEKKVRNLEKRKGRLDNYRDDRNKGNALNEDQKSAVAKYDEVLQMLEFAKEVQKAVNQSLQESMKLNKKIARREQVEKQQLEMSRIKEVLLFKDLLNNLGCDKARTDLLAGSNGAPVLSSDNLNSIDELYKLVATSQENISDESKSHDEILSSASEHLVYLIDGKNKEVAGLTYKELKELLMKVHNSKYFEKELDTTPTEEKEDCEEIVSEEKQIPEEPEEPNPTPQFIENDDSSSQQGQLAAANHSQQVTSASDPTSANFNFLQESQIDLESPHMDPAVVRAHPMAPAPQPGMPPTAGYTANSGIERTGYHPMPEAPLLDATQKPIRQGSDGREEFNPTQPIPSQTFTNQNFNTSIPQSFNNIQHLPSQQVLHTNNQENQTNGPPPPIPLPNEAKSQEQSFASAAHMGFNNADSQVFNHNSGENNAENNQNDSGSNYLGRMTRGYIKSGHKSMRGFGNRGTGNNYRGRGNYHNGRGGSYQGGNRDNYYQSNNYNGRDNYKTNRGAPRGAGGSRGSRGSNSRGRGSYNRDQ